VDRIDDPIRKIVRILENYRDRYLMDKENFPGGCLFVTLSVELDDLRPHLAKEVNEGFIRFKAMIKRYLDQARDRGRLENGGTTEEITEMIFSGMLGASLMYGASKSRKDLNETMKALISYLQKISAGRGGPEKKGQQRVFG